MDPEPFQPDMLLALADAGGGFGALQVVLLCVMVVLLFGSAFFSGSETALFGLTAGERLELRRLPGTGSRSVIALLERPRLLLIMLLLGNMSMNVLYFVISSVLMMHDLFGWFGDIIFALGVLLGIVLLSELLPKYIASAHRIRFARTVGPALYGFRQGLLPLWKLIDICIVTPLNRLTAPATEPPGLSSEELQALVELSGREGLLDSGEQLLLQDVLRLGHTLVRRVMTPRTRMHSLDVDAGLDDVRELVRDTRQARLPVHEGTRDEIVGILHVKSFLQQAVHDAPSVRNTMVEPVYMPEVTTLDKALDHFRNTSTQMAIVVDEYGGTAGVITLEDIIEELVGELGPTSVEDIEPPRSVGPDQWSVDGNLSTAPWRSILAPTLGSRIPATVAGLVTRLLQRTAEVGDVVQISNLRLEVHHVEQDRVTRVLLTLVDDDAGGRA